jgi:general secretion pathway protein H
MGVKAVRVRTATSPTESSSSQRGSRGFTLLEVIVVLVIAAVAFSVVLAFSGKGAGAADLRAAARSIAAGLRQAQSIAMATRRDTTLKLDVEAREFFLPDGRAHRLPEGIELKLYTAQTEVMSERVGSIRFHPDGSSTGGRVTVSSGDRKYLVDVDWLTGRVSVED